MTTYLPRSTWTSTSAVGAVLTGSSLVGVAVHYPGSGNVTFGVESQAKVAERLRGWRTWHVTGRKWSDIGYNFAVDQAGRVWMLRSTDWKGNRVGAHSASASNPSANQHRVGVLLILGNNEQPSAAMLEAFRHWRHNRFLASWGTSKTDLRGHGQVPGASTSCPGAPVRTLISNGSLARKPSGSGGGSTPPPTTTPPPSGGTMSWDTTLTPTSTAAGRIPSSYTKKAGEVVMHILGLTYQTWRAKLDKIPLNVSTRNAFPDEPADGYTDRVLQRANFGHLKFLRRDVAELLKLAREEKAARGSEARDEVLASIEAELSTASAERQAIADRLDEAGGTLIEMRALLADFETGQLDAEAVVRLIGERLTGEPDES